MVENQPASITITLNHVHAAVTWKRFVPLSLVTRSRCKGVTMCVFLLITNKETLLEEVSQEPELCFLLIRDRQTGTE